MKIGKEVMTMYNIICKSLLALVLAFVLLIYKMLKLAEARDTHSEHAIAKYEVKCVLQYIKLAKSMLKLSIVAIAAVIIQIMQLF